MDGTPSDRLFQLMSMMNSQLLRTPEQLADDLQHFLSVMQLANRPVDPNPTGPAMEELAREFGQFVSIRENDTPAPMVQQQVEEVEEPVAQNPDPFVGMFAPPSFLEPIFNSQLRTFRNLMAVNRHSHRIPLRRDIHHHPHHNHHNRRRFDSPMEMVAQAMRLQSSLVSRHSAFFHENNLKTNIVLAYHQRMAVTSNEDHTIVFVWDLEDMTMLSKRRMEKIAAKKPDIDSMSLRRLIDNILNGLGFGDQEEVASRFVMNIEDAFNNDFTLARKYLDLKNLYTSIPAEDTEGHTRISHTLLEKCGMVDEEEKLCQEASKVQKYQHHRWRSVKKSLNIVNRRSSESTTHNYANVVLSKRGVPQAAVEILVSGNASAVPIENIYSRLNMSKTVVWRRIQRRFGANCSLIYITSSFRSYPKDMNIRVTTVQEEGSIDYIYNAQRAALQ